jgi:hypothetical protein
VTDEPLRASLDLARRAGTLRVRNVLNPLLWLTAVTMPTGVGAAIWIGVDHWTAVLLILVGVAPVLAALIAYAIFAVRSPDRLQSEEYVLRSMELRMIERRGGEATSLDAVPLRPDPAIGRAEEGDRR